MLTTSILTRPGCQLKIWWFYVRHWPNYYSLPAASVLRSFVQYLVAFSSWPKAATDVISGKFLRPIIADKWIKLRDSYLNRSQENPPEAVGGGFFDSFFRDNFWPEVASEVGSGAAAYHSVKAPVIFNDSRSNVPDIFERLILSRTNERPWLRPIAWGVNAFQAFRLKWIRSYSSVYVDNTVNTESPWSSASASLSYDIMALYAL